MRTYFKRGFTALVAFAFAAAPLLLPRPVYAQTVFCGGTVVPMTSSGETLTVSNTAKILTASKYATTTATARVAVIDVETDAVRWWDDTSVPTAAVGHKAAAGAQIVICGMQAIKNFQMIRVTNDATATVSYYKGE